MIQSLVGSMLREQRERYNVSQEDLCDTVCAVSTLSRLENGKHIPSRKTVEYFFSKLGMPAPLNMIPLSDEDFIRFNIESDVLNLGANGNYEILELLEKYKNASDKMDKFERQFYESAMAMYHKHHGLVIDECQKEFIHALNYTITDFELGKPVNAHFLSSEELVILNNIAITEYDLGNTERAIYYLEFLVEYSKKPFVSERERGRYLPFFLFNLSNYYGKLERYEEALKMTEEGITACIKYGNLNNFPYFLFNKGFGLSCLGDLVNGRKNIEDSFRIFDQMKKHDNVVFASKEVNKRFGFDFPEV